MAPSFSCLIGKVGWRRLGAAAAKLKFLWARGKSKDIGCYMWKLDTIEWVAVVGDRHASTWVKGQRKRVVRFIGVYRMGIFGLRIELRCASHGGFRRA